VIWFVIACIFCTVMGAALKGSGQKPRPSTAVLMSLDGLGEKEWEGHVVAMPDTGEMIFIEANLNVRERLKIGRLKVAPWKAQGDPIPPFPIKLNLK
jgi:hypothetical protein